MPRISACLALLLTLVLLAAPEAQAQQRGRGEPIVIMNNRGGNVVEAIRYRNRLAASGRPVEVRGYCRSACTIYITLPNACLGPNATVGFHAPRLPGTRIIPPIVDELMAQYYRNGILQMWNARWKHSLQMQKISAREYVRLDPQTRLCRR
ncbi:hypothetical protein NM680_12190 [Paracoccus sp. PS-1]|uniref:hypothetical protein n=1 Tax=unclassified Paracoccus (in: a-proteobacteria) TaxID=2688777 RepID=UPI0004BB72EE|nr:MULTISPECIES: hypothetical protein [unclassified Paracoccus (in: a-proteobacteria)]MDQ7262555.1 hypothetical protein [Paracoccus sp. PS1]UFM65068.1 hypothetical protein LOS78_15505 [Paracoccus sp. MA]